MQSRGSAQAGPQTPASDHHADPAKNTLAGQTLEQLTELAALGWSVSEHYGAQIKHTGATAKAEWRLSGRSLTIAAGLLVFLGAGTILLWGTLLALLGYTLFQLTGSLVISASAALVLQCVILLWCWRSLNYVLTQVGFNETWQQLRRLLFATDAPAATSQNNNATAQQESHNADR